jgi:hypothetical protein
MITAVLLNILFGIVWVITYPLRVFDDVSLPADIASSISTANGYLFALDYVAPVSTLLTIFALFLTIEGGILTWKAINWLLRRLPTQS